MLGSRDLVEEHIYLVERGVRALALFEVDCDPDDYGALSAELDRLGENTALVPFSTEEGKIAGIAQHSWASNLFIWARQNCPDVHYFAIVGLLLGYDSASIDEFVTRVCNSRTAAVP